jgi:hypothetical protein
LWSRVKALRVCLGDFQALLGHYFLNPKPKSRIRMLYSNANSYMLLP